MRDYLAHIAYSGRWRQIDHRPGDIVLSVPSKCGTTWTQMLVALLIFDTADLPAPLSELSPWIDMRTEPIDALRERIEAQAHRRFFKTHVPLDGLPLQPDVSYIVVGRDPRDAWVSMEHHLDNLDVPKALAQRCDDGAGDPEPWPDLPDEPGERFRAMLDRPVGSNHTNAHLAQVVHHLLTGWRRRHQPNVLLLHYADMMRDLPAVLGQIASFLGIERSQQRLAELAEAAALDAMRSRATELAPNASADLWRDPAAVFRGGTSRSWAPWFTPATEAVYWRRVAELAPDEGFDAWLHRQSNRS